MKILIAGGCGYIGSALVPALLDYGYQVEVIDLLWFGNHLPKGIKLCEKELFNCSVEDFEGFDQVIFLAGLSNDPMAEFNPSLNFVSNAALPSYLAYCAKKANVKRFIYASSCSVYGYTVNELYDENALVTCAHPYGISKLQGERGVLQMQDDKFSVIALRKGTICGYSPRMRFDLIVNAMFKSVLTNGIITVNNPSIWRPIVDIRDVISAYLRAIQADYRINGVFNIASDNYTVGQVTDLVKRKLQILIGRKIKLDIKNIQDVRNYKVKFDKAKTVLGYEPNYTIEEIVDNLYEHLNEYGDMEQDAYYNIKVFKNQQMVAI